MSVISEAVEGITRGLMGWMFDPKVPEAPLPPYQSVVLNMSDIQEDLTHTFGLNSNVELTMLDKEQLSIIDVGTKRIIAKIHPLHNGSPLRPTYINPNLDQVHLRNRDLLWVNYHKLSSRSNISSSYLTYLNAIDSLVATGKCRISTVMVSATAGVLKVDAVLFTGSINDANRGYLHFHFVDDDLKLDTVGATKNSRFGVTYSDLGDLSNLSMYDLVDGKLTKQLDIWIEYKPDVIYPKADGWDARDSLIPECVKLSLNIDAIHGRLDTIVSYTGKSITMYRCTDTDDRSISVTLTY